MSRDSMGTVQQAMALRFTAMIKSIVLGFLSPLFFSFCLPQDVIKGKNHIRDGKWFQVRFPSPFVKLVA